MKTYLYLLFSIVLISSQVQAQEARNLGSVDLSKNKDYYLSAFEKGGKFTYKIFNQNDPATEVASFSLVNNNSDNFKEMLESAIRENSLIEGIAPGEIEKYFFYFSTQNVFQIENEPGKKAMEMVFNEELPVYAYHHSNFASINVKDIYYMLKWLFPNQKVDTTFLENPYASAQYNLKLCDTCEVIFKAPFLSNLDSISSIKNKNERLITLYKSINKEYYDAIQLEIKVKLEEYESTMATFSNELETKIIDLRQEKLLLKSDSSLYKSEIELFQQKIKTLDKSISENEKIVKEPINRYEFTLPEEESESEGMQTIEISNLQNFINEIEEIYTKISTNQLIHLSTELQPFFDSTDISYESSLQRIKTELSKLKNVQTALNSIRRDQNQSSLIRDSILINNDKLIFINDTLSRVESELGALTQELNDIETEKSKEVSDQLKQLFKTNKFEFRPSSVQLEINSGYIENITVNGSASIFDHRSIAEKDKSIVIPEYHLKFINDYPFGISSKKDIEQLGNYKLYARFKNGTHYELKMGDLVDVITEKLELDRKDYSPKDGSYEVILPTENKKTFFKADSKEILQLKIFSDFVGIQDNNPNGLIQLEIDKEIPLLTKRFQRPYVFFLLRLFVLNQANIGVFNYFKPQFIYSKIENNNKYLEVASFSTGAVGDGSSAYGVSTLDLKQYEVFSVGADFNLFLYDIPNTKSTFLFNTGFRFGRTDLALNKEEPEAHDFPRGFTNTIQPSLEGLLRINGDERFGFEFSYGINWLLSDELFFTQKAKVNGFTGFESFSKSNENNTLQRVTILAYLNINKENQGRLFFRYRFNSEFRDFKNNFAQLQIGYTTYLTRPNK
ncbi:hypothetical protein SAMN04489724_0638 [Algoriphagus locisalis]|uniref:Outer membrane protein beta-barrel family protein n=1 Tax=Algoriphagus locisalis TaxID=305507 RepID=A0A1I6XSL9_9BACT|nr:hypothetical protein [Algoriphagus locisalis]SFT41107.1 hypothetical protein SAMN04489724_0638 [Algoriphagus locisalis]